jgi:membrane protein YdbS with pleckstrin-like domain
VPDAGQPTTPPEPAHWTAGPLPGDAPAHRHRLPTRTATYWRIKALMSGGVIVGLAIWGAVGLSWPSAALRWVVVGVLAGWLVLVRAVLGPPIRRRLFWYALSDVELDVQHGWLTRRRTVIPMSRVQHLKSEQGVLARRFRLADLHLHTAAGTVVVNGLDQDEATAMRARIGLLAEVADDL